MASLTLPPFHVLSRSDVLVPGVSPGEWEVNGRSLEDGILSGWDYGKDVVARRTVKLQIPSIREQARLGAGSVVRLCATWRTGSGFECQELGFSLDVSMDGSHSTVELELSIPGESLAFAVVLSTTLVLARRGPRSGLGSALHPGSVLWQDDHSITLEGAGPRVPVLIVDLEPENTAWAVRTSQDWLNTHPSVGVHVLINRRREDIVKAFLSEPPSDTDVAMRSALFFDVGRQLIERALLDGDFVDDAPYPPQTCGVAMRSRIRTIFDRGIEEVRSLRELEPEEFNNLLQAGHSLFVVSGP